MRAFRRREALAPLLLALALLLAIPPRGRAAEDAPPLEGPQKRVVRMSLAEAIDRALERSVEIEAALGGLRISESQIHQARMARWLPKAEMTQILTGRGEIKLNRGDDPSTPAIEDPDEDSLLTGGGKQGKFLDSFNVFYRVEIEAVQPLYTFGKLDAALKLATAGSEVARQRVREKEAEIRKRVKLLYWGLLVARDVEKVLGNVRKNLDDAYESVKEKLEAETGEVTNIDLYKLELFQAQLQTGIEEIKKRHYLAQRTLALLLVLEPDEVFEPAERHLDSPEFKLQALEYYKEAALQGRPDLGQLRAGLQARQAQVDLARAHLYPDLFLGAKWSYAVAPNVDDPGTAFAYNPYNTGLGPPGVFLGLRWDLALHRKKAELDTARAELIETEALGRAAHFGISVKVEDAYFEFVRARNSHEALQRALKSAKKWFRASTLNFGIGIADTDELIKAYKEYIQLRAQFFEATFDYNQALASLRQEAALGPEPEESAQ